MLKLKTTCSNFLNTAITGYLVMMLVFGLWSMMTHIYWVVPFLLVGTAIVTQKQWLIYFNLAAATVMAFVGLAYKFKLTWYLAIVTGLAPLAVLLALWSLVNRKTEAPRV